MPSSVSVTLGIATYNRDTYLAEAIASGLAQDYPELEVLVVVDGSTNPRIDEVLAQFAGEKRLRVVRHPTNRGIAAAYNTFVSEGRGELIAMIGDDDLCLPGRIRRQVEMFERHPDAGIVHGDAIVINAQGRETGVWASAEFTQAGLVQAFYRSHNHLVDPTRMVHRRVYERVGGYDSEYQLANDFDFFLRAVRHFRFRHCPGGPLVAIRRHGENTSDEKTGRAVEIDDTERLLEAGLERFSLRELVPELDWSVLDRQAAERQALERLADHLERRLLPLPRLAGKLRTRAAAMPRAAKPAPPKNSPRRILITSFGYNDSGGGTTVPRLVSKELANRGWEVTVFHAATSLTESRLPYEVLEWEEDGVRLIGVHNRFHGIWDLGHPLRELDDPPISETFARVLDRVRPDVVHYYNLHNLGASLMDHTAARGIPAHFTPNNYWLICPRAYLMDGSGKMCAGPGDGSRCAGCVGSTDAAGHVTRLASFRATAHAALQSIQAVSASVRRTLIATGYDPELVDVVRQAMPEENEIWNRVGRGRRPGRCGEALTVGFLGSAFPHKGPQLLVEAAQYVNAELRVKIHGEVPAAFANMLSSLDRRGVVELTGKFSPSEIADLLRDVDVVALPSMWWDCAPLAAFECLAARVPVLVPRLGGLAESVEDGVTGLLFNPLDAHDLARALDQVATEDGLLERMQAAIQAPPPFSSYVDELEEYYAGGRSRRVNGVVPTTDVAVRWQGDHGLSTSLSIINDHVSSRLDMPVQRITSTGSALNPPLPNAASVEVRHQWPPSLERPAAGALAAIVPWEFGAVPRDWVAQINANVDELWVPSEYVRAMYIAGGVPGERVRAIPNGVDLELFSPSGPGQSEPRDDSRTRFLFVGGLIWRKGPDLLLEAFRRAFAGRDDVVLAVKDFGADGVYRGADRGAFRAYAGSGELPALELIDAELTAAELAQLYRSCDVLVHPYRGEGFAMPVLEAMACGLPVIVTGGGPTDEFCPPEAGWRIRSRRVAFPEERVDTFDTAGRPWVLEPEVEHLVELLRDAAAADPAVLAARGAAGSSAAQALSWDAVAGRYTERINALAARRPLGSQPTAEPFPLTEEVELRVLATPAWRGTDRLGELLRQWSDATTSATSACLYLLADPAVAGTQEAIEAYVLSAGSSAGANLESCADINVLVEPLRPDRDERLHRTVDVYVPLHPGCAGQQRLAERSGSRVCDPGSAWLSEALAKLGSPVRSAA